MQTDMNHMVKPEAERAVLGAILLDGKKFTETTEITASDFFEKRHQAIFATMTNLYKDEIPIDLVTVASNVPKTSDGDALVESSYLSRLMDGVPKLTNVSWYAKAIKNASVLRQQAKAANKALQYIADGGDDPQELSFFLEEAKKRGFAHGSTEEFCSASDAVAGLLEGVGARQRGEATAAIYSTGKERLDNFFKYEPGKLYVIAGRPGMAKTSFALDQALTLGRTMPGLFFEQEMSKVEIAMRLVSNVARVPFGAVRDASPEKSLTEEQLERLKGAHELVKETIDLEICDLPGRSIEDVERLIITSNNQRDRDGRPPLGFLVFDYLQIASLRGGTRNEAIGYFTMTLKNIARKYNLIVILLSQLSRPDKKSYDKTGVPPPPRLDDLRDSGCIEQDADVVMFLHRPEYYLVTSGRPAGEWAGVIQVPISKNRGGEPGMAALGWVGELMLVTDPIWGEEVTNDGELFDGTDDEEEAWS